MKRRASICRLAGWILLIGMLNCGCSKRPEISWEALTEMTEVAEKVSQKNEEQMETSQKKISSEQELVKETQKEVIIQVYVCGAVQFPGVYSLEETSRVYEAVEAAGGFSADADQEWLNQAQNLQDGEKIRVYTKQETDQMRQSGMTELGLTGKDEADLTAGSIDSSGDEKVNLNTATKEQLMTLPGIGEAKAEAVISYRETQGAFGAIEEIMNISGIKDAVFLKIKDRITV